ncbi:predicted protein [Histoplasma mississippiense (nom. inval.)]|uniref:predicted protein n=1 Tax=Ajellomyces capsulatus (strain NAm1 / WU24) TaxID=2059318 RepID=UPI000157C05A|nr:predicted protein [Histoplasma mississippiense (nom. inval.)]XP_001541063.1 predicted protein [Histoplasma mississippiense (nom. inval.)]EDN05396.1 predicted protein [Histoplasma mississippiense (nom. inval.)]EDN06630.1 predicted protein [Histoplasma mississippiense (nom. inval.)]
MPRRRRGRPTSSSGSGTTDQLSPFATDSESDRGYENELTEPDSDAPCDRRKVKRRRRRLRYKPNTPVPKGAAVSVTDDSDDDTDPEDDTDDEILSEDEDDDYAFGTRNNIARLEDHWQRKKAKTSADPKWQDPVDALRAAGRRNLYLFLNWRFKLKFGKGGRRLKGTRKSSSLDGDWKNFLRYHEGATGTKLDGRLMRLMRKSLRRLAKKHGLDTQQKEKDPVYVEDTATLQKTGLRTQEKRFWLGLQRMQICLYNLLGLFTLNRKSAILNLRFKDLRVSLQRDPSGGPHLPTVEFSYEFTKKHLGLTQTNTFTLPEIIYEPSLILSPHIFLFGILFFFEAFSPPSLTSMAKLRGLKIEGGRQQLLIPLKPEMANHYVFCRVAKEDGEVRIFPEEMMDPSSSVRSMAEIAGFLHPWFNHRFRYGGGLILNKSGLVGDAEQNLVLKHASIRTFLDHYIPRRVGLNMQALISGLDPNAPLIRAITRIGRFLDKRRPRHLTDAQKAIVEQDPELQEAIQKRDRAKRRAVQTNDPEAIEKLEKRTADVKKTRRRLLYKHRKRVREEFDDEQAVIDIERQLSGEAVDEEAKETLRDEQLLPQMIYLFSKLLTWPTSRSVEEELRRRDAGADAVQMYCGVLEGGPRRGRRPKPPPPPPPHPPQAPDGTNDRNDAHGEVTSAGGWDDALRAAKDHIRDAKQPRGCFECYAHPGSSDHRRIHRYSRPAGLGRHFRDEHLRHLKDGEPAWCSWCEIKLEHRMHVQNHAKIVHRVHT